MIKKKNNEKYNNIWFQRQKSQNQTWVVYLDFFFWGETDIQVSSSYSAGTCTALPLAPLVVPLSELVIYWFSVKVAVVSTGLSFLTFIFFFLGLSSSFVSPGAVSWAITLPETGYSTVFFSLAFFFEGLSTRVHPSSDYSSWGFYWGWETCWDYYYYSTGYYYYGCCCCCCCCCCYCYCSGWAFSPFLAFFFFFASWLSEAWVSCFDTFYASTTSDSFFFVSFRGSSVFTTSFEGETTVVSWRVTAFCSGALTDLGYSWTLCSVEGLDFLDFLLDPT